jgi:DMSO/TMAO reductase YedYZ heme-binding membrane subunit
MSLDTLAWTLSRGAGLTAFLLLALSVALGLALSLRAASPRWPLALSAEGHRVLTALALAATGLHVALLLVDPLARVSLADALVPFADSEQRLAVALGVITLYVAAFTWATTAARARLGAARWRRLHRLAAAAFWTALAHGLLAGTSSGEPWAVFLYVATAIVVGGLLLARLTAPARRPAPPPGPSAAR